MCECQRTLTSCRRGPRGKSVQSFVNVGRHWDGLKATWQRPPMSPGLAPFAGAGKVIGAALAGAARLRLSAWSPISSSVMVDIAVGVVRDSQVAKVRSVEEPNTLGSHSDFQLGLIHQPSNSSRSTPSEPDAVVGVDAGLPGRPIPVGTAPRQRPSTRRWARANQCSASDVFALLRADVADVAGATRYIEPGIASNGSVFEGTGHA